MSAAVAVNDTEPAIGNVEAEAVLLGAMMQANTAIDRVAEELVATDFIENLHGRIYAAIVREHALGKGPVTPVTLKPYFADDAAMREVGGMAYLARMTGSGAGVVAIPGLVEQIRDLARRRRLIERLGEVIGHAGDYEKPVAELVREADDAMNAALRLHTAEQSLNFAEAFDLTLQAIEDEAAGLGPQGIRIHGLDDFNDLTGDIRRGELVYIGGRPSMGKTALSIRLAIGAAQNGHGVQFESLEMRVHELATRAMADLIFEYGQTIGFNKIRRGDIDHFTREQLKEARARIAELPLILSDPSSLSIGRLAMKIRRMKRRMEAAGQSLDLVIIDYLGLIKGTGKSVKRYEEVGEISRTLKEVAKECDVAMVVLAQLNRECEKRDDKRPMLSDLRDAGDIEQDADMVMFVYRDEYYLERAEPDAGDKKRAEWEISMGYARDRMEIIAAKVRNGRVGKRNLYFFAQHQAVRNSSYMRDLNHGGR